MATGSLAAGVTASNTSPPNVPNGTHIAPPRIRYAHRRHVDDATGIANSQRTPGQQGATRGNTSLVSRSIWRRSSPSGQKCTRRQPAAA